LKRFLLLRLFLPGIYLISVTAQAQAELSVAIKNYDAARVYALIAEGADVNAPNANGATPLMEAVITNQHEVSLALLEAGADVNARLPGVETGSSVTNFAAQYADLPLLRLILERGASTEGSLLAMAYANRQSPDTADITQLLLEAGAPLDETVRFHDLFSDRSLIDYFQCVKSVSNLPHNGGLAQCEGMSKVIVESLDSANVRYLGNPDSLAFTAMFAGPNMMEALLRTGLNPNEIIQRSPDIYNSANALVYGATTTTPLELALYKRNRAVVPLLLEAGARLDFVDPGILQMAALDPALEAILREAGVDTVNLIGSYNASHQQCGTPIRERAYVSFIFDDGERTDLDIIKRMFLPRGMVGTVAPVSDIVGLRQHMDVRELEALEQAGWEIASHSESHPDLSTLGEDGVESELEGSRDALTEMGFDISVMVYPFGSYNEIVLEQVAIKYDGAFAGGYKLNTPNANIYALTRYNISNKHSYEDYLAVLDQAMKEGNWLIWAVHTGYDLGWEQQQNLDRLLGVLCERGIAVTTASGGLLRLK
jgi:ankyrin repeat protein